MWVSEEAGVGYIIYKDVERRGWHDHLPTVSANGRHHALDPSIFAVIVDGVTETHLANGLKVILLENHKAPVATFQVWYRAGSRNDPWGKSGLAHVFEHLMFKGTPEVGRDDFTRIIQEIGGNFNAFTSHDYAAYFENVAGDRLAKPIRLEADRMKNLDFTSAEFETEKKVVMEERRLRTQDQPKAFLMEQAAATAFQAQPYHWPVVGWMDDLARIEYEDAVRFYRRYYDPANALIVAVGDFETPDRKFSAADRHPVEAGILSVSDRLLRPGTGLPGPLSGHHRSGQRAGCPACRAAIPQAG